MTFTHVTYHLLLSLSLSLSHYTHHFQKLRIVTSSMAFTHVSYHPLLYCNTPQIILTAVVLSWAALSYFLVHILNYTDNLSSA